MKFYPQDWRGDVKLQSCSLTARGLWKEMMCIMHEAEPYGHLLLGDMPVSPRRLATLVGITEKVCLELLAELGTAGVFSRNQEKVIFSRRMVRDEEKSQKGRADIAKRWGQGVDDTDPSDTPTSPPNINPSSPPNSDPIRGATASAITPESRDQTIDDDEGAAPARVKSKLISQEAMNLAEELLVIAGHSPSFWPPGWCGAPMRVETWFANGWTRDPIISAAKATMLRKRDGPPKSVQYFENAIASEIARQSAPLPKGEVQHETASTRRAQPASGGFATIAAKLRSNQPSGPGG